MNSRLILKQELLDRIKQFAENQGINPEYPLTDTLINSRAIAELDQLTTSLEALNPFPQPLVYATSLLDGIWQLNYSTAREIRSLNNLPFGFKLERVYQTINTKNASFFNIAFVKHNSGLIKGNVKVTASFSPAIKEGDLLPKDIINVNFEKRYISIKKVAGLKIPFLDPFRVIPARNPQGRIPSLKVTYIDKSMRIGRGGDDSLFILSKTDEMKM